MNTAYLGDQLERAVVEKGALHLMVQQFKEQNRELQQRVALAEKKSYLAELEKLNVRFVELGRAKSELESRMVTAQRENDAFRVEMIKCQQERSALQRAHDDARRQLQQSVPLAVWETRPAELERLYARVEELEKDKSDLESRMGAVQRENDGYRDLRNGLREGGIERTVMSALTNLHRQLTDVKGENSGLRAALAIIGRDRNGYGKDPVSAEQKGVKHKHQRILGA